MAEYSNNRIPLVVIVGPTATGKSGIAVELAGQINGEVVSADSMQIYKGLDIGTAKITESEMRGIPHHMIDILSPNVSYSVADYVRDSETCIEQIVARGKTPILCGGTGLYISSLIDGVKIQGSSANSAIRELIGAEYDIDDGETLYRELSILDPQYAKKIHRNDRKRLVRAIERFREEGMTPTESDQKSREIPSSYNLFDMILLPQDRKELYSRIDQRVETMMKRGLLQEASYVYENRARFITAAQAIGYKEFFPYFEKNEDISSCVEQLKQSTRRYAKRQITWFKRMHETIHVDSKMSELGKILCEFKKHLKV